MRITHLSAIGVFALVILFACKKKEAENPYEDLVYVVQNDNPDTDDLPVGNFAWLQGKIFKPTCANSGCHDGTFEPKFNTISSSYNTLVNHDVISNDAGFSFEYRVKPGDFNASLLHERLTNNIPNSSGIMPLEVDEDSDWDELSTSYITAIETWISQGAPDMFGNMPGTAGGDFPPQVDGLVIFPSGNTTEPYERIEDGIGITPIVVDAAAIDIWTKVSDDQTPVANIAVNEVRLAETTDSFESGQLAIFSTSETLNALDFSNTAATFNRKATIDLSGFESGTTLFIRTYFDDGVQTAITEVPNENSNEFITALFVIQVQ
ncbi:MAG: hypothetical protein P8H59_02220 [Flavobacteriales bacterium]|nr:hypothetical protein [Flavobacteriales bacterium]MDG1779740.1 hypothetical protein [Flavobacteriales bacterium]MDG2247199.1 hypothetical protein [Flavobacteriales bacterium]